MASLVIEMANPVIEMTNPLIEMIFPVIEMARMTVELTILVVDSTVYKGELVFRHLHRPVNIGNSSGFERSRAYQFQVERGGYFRKQG